MVVRRIRRRVVVTGAAGRIGRAVIPRLSQEWEVRQTDLNAGGGMSALDVSDSDACRLALTDADAVIHLAAVPGPAASWAQLLPANIVSTKWRGPAADCGVRRLVLASSLHSVSAMPDQTQSRTSDPPRPGNLYGATKAWAEAIGAWIAATTPTSVVALRIGYFAEQRPDAASVPPRELSAWLSPRDAAELVRCAVDAEVSEFVVANGISANRYRIADLQDTTQQLDYHPVDDAWPSRQTNRAAFMRCSQP
jgi:nucleoside-diphosphate-sugar epimerase